MWLSVTDHIGAELEENLGAIEEVTGYVKIVRSYALLSLRFLKSLTVIGGERLYDNRLVLYPTSAEIQIKPLVQNIVGLLKISVASHIYSPVVR